MQLFKQLLALFELSLFIILNSFCCFIAHVFVHSIRNFFFLFFNIFNFKFSSELHLWKLWTPTRNFRWGFRCLWHIWSNSTRFLSHRWYHLLKSSRLYNIFHQLCLVLWHFSHRGGIHLHHCHMLFHFIILFDLNGFSI